MSNVTIPSGWMPAAKMERIIIHWTAGAYKANGLDKDHYHILIEGDGNLIRGKNPITANQSPIKGSYAAHTLNCNSGSIGVSMCCMAGATESPANDGKYPLTAEQFGVMIEVVAQLAKRYGIPVTPQTILTHAEVQPNLGIKQKGKWDITRLPFKPSVKGAKAVGDLIRAEVSKRLGKVTKAEPAKPAVPSMNDPFRPGVYDAECERLQQRLRELGYSEVGLIDGKWGPKTRGALLAFKADNGLPLNTVVDDAVWAALGRASPRPAPEGRADAKTAPSAAAKAAQGARLIGGAAAGVGVADAALQPVGGISGAIDTIAGWGETAGRLSGALAPIRDLATSIADNWPIALAVVGVILFLVGRHVFNDELESFKAGEWS